MRVKSLLCSLAVALILGLPGSAFAGDAATVVFNSGQVVRIDDGYRQIVEAMRTLDRTKIDHRIVELNIGGGTFLLDVADAVIVCRDKCESLIIVHQLDPKRTSNRSE